MELSDFGGLRGLDNVLVGFLRIGGGKSLKAKTIDLGRSGCACTPAFGVAFYGTHKRVPFRGF
jgi:hypothetical protein